MNDRNEVLRDLAKRVKLFGIPGLASAESSADQEEIVTNWILRHVLDEDDEERGVVKKYPEGVAGLAEAQEDGFPIDFEVEKGTIAHVITKVVDQ